MGINTKQLIEAFVDCHQGDVHIPSLLGANPVADDPPPEGTIASVMLNSSIYHSHQGIEEDCLAESDVYIDLGEDTADELEEALDASIQWAKEGGMSDQGLQRLTAMIKVELRSIFKVRLGKSEPAKVTPMHIRIKDGCAPVKVRARRYSAEQRSFLNSNIDELVKMGFLVPNINAEWQAAPLLVMKNSEAKFRMTVDLRPVNASTVKQAWPMPHIDSELFDFSGSSCFSVLNFVSGYWQLPVHLDSQSMCGTVTPNGVYSSTRVLQGLTNATCHFQGTVEPLFKELRSMLKAWLDDFTLHAKSEEELLEGLRKYFQICQRTGLFLSAKKNRYFKQSVRWCGRIITKDGYTMDPTRASALKDISLPKAGGELCEFVHCCKWISRAIPAFAQTTAPLTAVLEEAFAKSKRRTERSIKNIILESLSWSAEHEAAFRQLQENLCESVKLTYPKSGRTICIFTDASLRF